MSPQFFQLQCGDKHFKNIPLPVVGKKLKLSSLNEGFFYYQLCIYYVNKLFTAAVCNKLKTFFLGIKLFCNESNVPPL